MLKIDSFFVEEESEPSGDLSGVAGGRKVTSRGLNLYERTRKASCSSRDLVRYIDNGVY